MYRTKANEANPNIIKHPMNFLSKLQNASHSIRIINCPNRQKIMDIKYKNQGLDFQKDHKIFLRSS